MSEKLTHRLVDYPMKDVLRRMSKDFLMWLANYEVHIDGSLPHEPHLLAIYPHSEHMDSLYLPAQEIIYLAARDTFFRKTFGLPLLFYVVQATTIDIAPITRPGKSETSGEGSQLQEMRMINQILKSGRHVAVYPQGSRLGSVTDAGILHEQIKSGIADMARLNQTPVLPIGIQHHGRYQPRKGGESAWSRFLEAFINRGTRAEPHGVTVRIGSESLNPPARGDDAKQQFMATLARELHTLSGGS